MGKKLGGASGPGSHKQVIYTKKKQAQIHVPSDSAASYIGFISPALFILYTGPKNDELLQYDNEDATLRQARFPAEEKVRRRSSWNKTERRRYIRSADVG